LSSASNETQPVDQPADRGVREQGRGESGFAIAGGRPDDADLMQGNGIKPALPALDPTRSAGKRGGACLPRACGMARSGVAARCCALASILIPGWMVISSPSI
jgi:hypothetical protein